MMFWKNLSLKESKNSKVQNSEKDEKVEYNYEKKLKLAVGTYQDAPQFIQDNEYIKNGYILNCNTYGRTFKSLFICHNELVNIWTHLLGSIFFIFLIWYTEHYISNYKSQIKTVKNDIFLIEKKSLSLNLFNFAPNKTSPTINNNPLPFFANNFWNLPIISLVFSTL